MMSKIYTIVGAVALFVLSVSMGSAQEVDPSKQAGSKIQADNYYPRVALDTSMGKIVIELNRNKAPLTVNNFLDYVQRKEYDNTLFHRIIADYIVQGGGYSPEFKQKEVKGPVLNESGNGLKNNYYSVAMARQDNPHSATRQFFFNMNDNENLDPGRSWGYTVFATVVEGTEVLDAMSQVETEYRPLIRFQDVPKEPIILKTATILPPL
ncbi:peptidylprolyl isomerase [Glaciecola siphonariae]|uniref:Peptidyl-prolyl cis-trans isomerase n=1 Tax=Glaciecola siphonariae TaxID=521012 RepID=A0ABV9LVB8_9ALTE